MEINLITVSIGILVLAVLVLGYLVYESRRRLQGLFGASIPETGGEALGQVLKRLTAAEQDIDKLQERLSLAEAIGKASIQKIGFIRFNPFANTGGDQSFAVCLLDRMNNGVVISSLYGREGTRVYAKSIEAGTPRQPLSDEEKTVLRNAIES